MRRLPLFLAAMLALVFGVAVMTRAATADTQPPPVTQQVLVSQRVEQLPLEPLCWTVFRSDLAPGGRFPAGDYLAAPLLAMYGVSGTQRLDFAGGPSHTFTAGAGTFAGQHNWFAHLNTGSTPAASLGFALACHSFPPAAPGLTLLGRTGPLPAIKPGPVPYQITFSEFQRAAGERGPVRLNPYAAAIYMLEGSLAMSTPAGVTVYQPGDLFLTPAGTPLQVGAPGSVRARYLVMELTAVGADGVLNPQGVTLPDPLTTPPTMPAPASAAGVASATAAAPASAAAFGNGALIRTVLLMPVADNNRVPHAPAAWQELERRLAQAVGGFTVHTGVRGAYEADGKLIEDESREYIASIRSWSALPAWLEVVRWAKDRFGQDFIYVEVAGVPELL